MDNVKVFVIYLFLCLKSVVGKVNQFLQLYGASVRHMVAQNSEMYTEMYFCQM